MKGARLRVMPLAWLAFSVLYLVFALSLEERRMPGDREGWDPGSTAVPVGIGWVMAATSAYLVVTDRREPEEHPDAERAGTRRLVLLTLAATGIYILVFRSAGFVISTSALLATLAFFYRQMDVRRADLRAYALWTSLAVAFTTALYVLGRVLIRQMQYLGRVQGIELLRNRLVTAIITLAVWTLLFLPLYRVLRRRSAGRELAPGPGAALLASITTLALFLVFQQMFRVSLPGGWTGW